MTPEPRPDDDAMDDEPRLEHLILMLEHLRRAFKDEEQELDLWNQEVDEAERTCEYGSTARQCETIRRDCAQLLDTTAETVMRICHECEDIDATKDAKYIRRVHDAWIRGARQPEDLYIHEAWSLWRLIVEHEWEFDYGDEDSLYPIRTDIAASGPNRTFASDLTIHTP